MAAGQTRGTATSPDTMGVGIITAAAVVLILAGVMHAMQGVVAIWAVIIIAFDVFVIWALIVSWQDLKNV